MMTFIAQTTHSAGISTMIAKRCRKIRSGSYSNNFRYFIFPIYHRCQNTGYLLTIAFIVHRCRSSSALVTPSWYMEVIQRNCVFAKRINQQSFVNPTLEQQQKWHSDIEAAVHDRSPIYRRLFQTHYRERQSLYFDSTFTGTFRNKTKIYQWTQIYCKCTINTVWWIFVELAFI